MKPFEELSHAQRLFVELMVFRCQAGFIGCQDFLNYCCELIGIAYGKKMRCDDEMQGEFLYIQQKILGDTLKDYTTPVQIEPSRVFPVRFIERMEANKIPISKEHVTMMSRAKILHQVPGSERYKYLKPARVKRDIKFIIPTLEMVFEYMKECSKSTEFSRISSKDFYEYYARNNWKIKGKKLMENWKLSASRWITNNFNQVPLIFDEPEESSKDWETVL